MVLLQRSWPCSRYRPQPMALPRAREMHSQAPGGGDMLTLCVPRCLTMAIFCPDVPQKRPRTGKRPLRGNISPPCIQNELALAGYARHVSEKFCKSPLEDTLREYLARKGPFSLHKPLESCTARRSCHDSAFARPCARKARGAGYRKRTSHCGRRSHHCDCARLRQPCAITAAAALWPVAQTHDSQCCGERAVQRCVCASCPAASARPQQLSLLALLGGRAPNDSRMFPWRILFHSSCPHFFGRRPPPSTQHKKGQRLLAFFARL